eukprot:1139140-Pelagomonas_calceolata.AAC.6
MEAYKAWEAQQGKVGVAWEHISCSQAGSITKHRICTRAGSITKHCCTWAEYVMNHQNLDHQFIISTPRLSAFGADLTTSSCVQLSKYEEPPGFF